MLDKLLNLCKSLHDKQAKKWLNVFIFFTGGCCSSDLGHIVSSVRKIVSVPRQWTFQHPERTNNLLNVQVKMEHDPLGLKKYYIYFQAYLHSQT